MTSITDYLSESAIEQFNRDGFVAVAQLLSLAEVQTIRDTFMEMNRNGPVEGLSEIQRDTAPNGYDPNDPLKKYPRMMHPHKHLDKPVGPLAMRYMLDARIRAILTRLMGEEPLAVQSMFYFKPPGSRGQDFHQDNFYLRVKPGTCMAAWIALDDCDEKNGAMSCVPRTASMEIQCPQRADPKHSFTAEYVAPPAGSTPQRMLLRAGDVLFFNGQTIHGSGPNRSSTRFRRSLICHYVPRSTSQMSHWYKAYSFDAAPVPIAVNQDGGPCGTPQDAPVSPH
jgi:phytanoyl-CoA hydroxylase